jgi:hypothetical protein
MREHRPPTKGEVHAHAAALRALASFLEYAKSIETIEDTEAYERALETYVKGVGSVFLDEIDATGAYTRKLPHTEDPDYRDYTHGIVMIVVQGIQTIMADEYLADLMAKLSTPEFAVAFDSYYKSYVEKRRTDDE